jgi:hypothetical protein
MSRDLRIRARARPSLRPGSGAVLRTTFGAAAPIDVTVGEPVVVKVVVCRVRC